MMADRIHGVKRGRALVAEPDRSFAPDTSRRKTPPEVEQVIQRPRQRNRRRPSELIAEPRRITDEQRHIVGPKPARIHTHANRHSRTGAEHLEDFTDGDRLTGADVVHPGRLAALENRPVGANGIADVRHLTPRAEIADHHLAVAHSRFDLRHLLREAGGGEHRVLPGPDMVERPSDRDGQAIRRRPLSEQLHRELAQPVGVRRQEWTVFTQRLIRGLVDHRRAGKHHARVDGCIAQRAEQIVRGADVGGEGRSGRVPGLADMRRPGTMVDGGRPNRGDSLPNAVQDRAGRPPATSSLARGTRAIRRADATRRCRRRRWPAGRGDGFPRIRPRL